MALDFPNAPMDGDTHAASGITYMWHANPGVWAVLQADAPGYRRQVFQTTDQMVAALGLQHKDTLTVGNDLWRVEAGGWGTADGVDILDLTGSTGQAVRLTKRWTSIPQMFAQTAHTLGNGNAYVGEEWVAAGVRYVVVADDALDRHGDTASGLRLKIAETNVITASMANLVRTAASVLAATEAADAANNNYFLYRVVQHCFDNAIDFLLDGDFIFAPGLEWDLTVPDFGFRPWRFGGQSGAVMTFWADSDFDQLIHFKLTPDGVESNVGRRISIGGFIGEILWPSRAYEGDGLIVEGGVQCHISDIRFDQLDGAAFIFEGLWDSEFSRLMAQNCGSVTNRKCVFIFKDTVDQNTNSLDITNLQAEKYHYGGYSVGGVEIGSPINGGGARHIRGRSNKAHYKPGVDYEGTVVDGADQTGTTLLVRTIQGALREGDVISVDGSTYTLGAGTTWDKLTQTASLEVSPAIGVSPADGAVVTVLSPQNIAMRIYGSNGRSFNFVQEQYQPLRDGGVYIDQGASNVCFSGGCQFGVCDYPIQIASDAGQDHIFTSCTFEGKAGGEFYIYRDRGKRLYVADNAYNAIPSDPLDYIQNLDDGNVSGTVPNLAFHSTNNANPVRLYDRRTGAIPGRELVLQDTYAVKITDLGVGEDNHHREELLYFDDNNITWFKQILADGTLQDMFRYFSHTKTLQMRTTTLVLDGGVRIVWGTGDPEGAVGGPQGSIYFRTDGAEHAYLKTSGTGVFGWEALALQSGFYTVLNYVAGTSTLQVSVNAMAYNNSVRHEFGVGNPEGVVAGGKGSIFHRYDGGGAEPSLYLKKSGTGTADWIAVPTDFTLLDYLAYSAGDGGTITATGTGFKLIGGTEWREGSGDPEGVLAAPKGSIYSRIDGGPLTPSLYVKGDGTGNTGWVALATV